MVMNVARLVVGTGMFQHNTLILRDTLHWQPVTQRIGYKTVMITFNFIRGTGPSYFNDVGVPIQCLYHIIRSGQLALS